MGEAGFPTRAYAGLTLPSGNYRALRIVLGEGGGELCIAEVCGDLEQSAQNERQEQEQGATGGVRDLGQG